MNSRKLYVPGWCITGCGLRRGGGCLRRVRARSSGSVSSVSVGAARRGDTLSAMACGAPATSRATAACGARATLAPSTASSASPARSPARSAGPPAATADTTHGRCPAIVNPNPPAPRATTTRRSELRAIGALRRLRLCCCGTITWTFRTRFSTDTWHFPVLMNGIGWSMICGSLNS